MDVYERQIERLRDRYDGDELARRIATVRRAQKAARRRRRLRAIARLRTARSSR